MTNTRVNIKGIDPDNIASQSEAEAGADGTKLVTALTTKQAIDYNLTISPKIGRGISQNNAQAFSVTTTTLTFPAQFYAMSDFTSVENDSSLSKVINTTFTAGDGNGCLDTGTLLNSTYYYVHGISDASNTLFDCVISLSKTSPTLPSGYTKSALLGTIKTSSIGEVDQYKVFTDSVSYAGTPSVHTGIYGTPASLASQYIIQFNATLGSEASKYIFNSSGNFTASGDVTAYSDIRIKHNIKPLFECLDKVKQLRGVSFSKINETSTNIGLIAQEVEKIFPEIVYEHDDGLKSVAYQNLVAVLIEAIKELSDRIDELENK